MIENLEESTKVPVKLPNGVTVQIEVNESSGGRKNVSADVFNFDDISIVIEGITTALKDTLSKAKPQKATVKFGLEISTVSGKLVSAIVSGSGKAILEITLEWNDQS